MNQTLIVEMEFQPSEAARNLVRQRYQRTSFFSGKIWNDDEGVPIQAHGGCMLYENGTYYWLAKTKMLPPKKNSLIGFNVPPVGVSCYSSSDLYNWKNLGLVLPAVKDDPTHELHTSKIDEWDLSIFGN